MSEGVDDVPLRFIHSDIPLSSKKSPNIPTVQSTVGRWQCHDVCGVLISILMIIHQLFNVSDLSGVVLCPQVCANIMEYCQTLLLQSSTQAQFSICLFSPSGSEPAGRDGGRAGQSHSAHSQEEEGQSSCC